MADAAGRLITLVAYDEDGLPRPLLVDADGNLLISNQAAAGGGSLEVPTGKLFTPVANDPDSLPRPLLVDADGYLKVAGGGGGRTKLFDNILTETGEWNFSNIPQDHCNLEILCNARGDLSSTRIFCYGYLNNDKIHSHYRYAGHYANSAHGADTADLPLIGSVSANTALAGSAGMFKAVIADYSSTVFRKNVRCWSGHRRDGTLIYMHDYFYEWENTAAINRLQICVGSGTGFLAGSRLQVWGTN